MRTNAIWPCLASAAALAVTAPASLAQGKPPAAAAEGVSDVGSFEASPYRSIPQLFLSAQEKEALRKLEDKHIQETRAFEDRIDSETRALRIKQYAEREALMKSFARR